MDVNQLVAIKLLNAVGQLNSRNSSYSNGQPDLFGAMLENAMGNFGGGTCPHCHGNNNQQLLDKLDTLNTLLSSINNARLNSNKDNVSTVSEQIKTPKKQINSNENKSVNFNNIGNIKSSNKDAAVRLIESKIGNQYVWGATGPNTFDCSGLVQYVYKNALGKNIPRTAYEQSKVGLPINQKDLQVGDLVFFDTMGKGRVSHVGMYVGNNEFVHAANEKDGIKKSKLTGYYQTHFKGARRP